MYYKLVFNEDFDKQLVVTLDSKFYWDQWINIYLIL